MSERIKQVLLIIFITICFSIVIYQKSAHAEDVQILINPDQIESQILHNEIVRDWTKQQSKEITVCANLQDELPSIEFIRAHIIGVKTPAIRFAKNKAWIPYDDRAFRNGKVLHEKLGFALKTTRWYIDCQHIDQINLDYEHYYGFVIYPPYWRKVTELVIGIRNKYSKELMDCEFDFVYDQNLTVAYQFYQNKWSVCKDKNVLKETIKAFFGDSAYLDREIYFHQKKIVGLQPYIWEKGVKTYLLPIDLVKPITLPVEPFPCVNRQPPAPWEEPYKWYPSE